MTDESSDRILHWPIAFSILLPLIFVLVWARPFDLVGLFVPAMILISWLASSAFAVVTCVRSFGVQAARDDRILFWPAILAVAGPIAFVLAWAGPFALIMSLVPYYVVLLWMVSGVCAVIAAVGSVYQRAWRRLLSTLVLPATLLVAAFNAQPFWDAGRLAGDYIHLFVMYPSYRAEIEKEPTNEPRLVLFEWSGGFVVSFGVLYDESDGITAAHRSAAWKKRAERVGADRVFGYTPAIGHFYFVGLH